MTEPNALDGVPLRHHDIQLSEVKLHCVEAGEGPRLVLLLHGFPELWFSWRNQIPALARAGFRVVAPDLRGYNTSSKPARVSDYRVDALARDVSELIRALGADRAAVVGHDWGAVVAWVFAMLHGDQLERLCVMNGPNPLDYRRVAKRSFEQLRRSWYIFFFQIPFLPEWLASRGRYAGMVAAFKGLVARGRMSQEDLDIYRTAASQPGALTAAMNYYRAGFRTSLSGRLPRFQPVDREVLVVWGQRDRFLLPELANPDPRWAPRSRVERLPEASHFVQMDQPDQVNSLLLDFLKQAA
jgi:pimeloyl-ACP methyl ester carboxylesterase